MARHVNRICATVVFATLCVIFYIYVEQATDLTEIGSFNLHITDLLFGLIIFCSLFGLKNWRGHALSEIMLLILSGLLLLSFCRGVIEVGNAAAGNAFRLYTVFTALIVFVYFWGRKLDYQWLFDKIIWLGWAIVFLGIARVALGFDAFIRNPEPYEEARIFNAAAALMLGQAALIALHGALMRPGPGRLWRTLCFLVFFVTVLVSNQRTATFATIAGAMAIFAFVPRRRDTTIIWAATIACASGIAVLALASLSDGELTEYLPRSLQMVAFQEGTFAWRIDQWQTYFQQWVDATPFDQIIGQPFGVTRAIGLSFSTLTELDPRALPAHSQYLQFLLNVGAIGLLIFLSVPVLSLIDALAASKRPQGLPPVILALAILVSQIVFSFSYSLDNEQGLLLAVSVQIIAVAQEASSRLQAFPPRSMPMQVPLYPERRRSSMRGA